MDESGCLGFDLSKGKSSKYFIVTFLYTKHPRKIDKIIKNIFKAMSKTERKALGNSLHANKSKKNTAKKLLSNLAEVDEVSILVAKVDKSKVFSDLKRDKPTLYNHITKHLLESTLIEFDAKEINLVASQRETNKFLNNNFKKSLKYQNNKNAKINVSVIKPSAEKCLQAVDFASWAIFRHYEHNDSEFYDIIKGIIKKEEDLFK